MMFDYLIESNGLMTEVRKYGLTTTDLKFVKEQIAGPLESEMCSQANDWPYEGRPKEKSFLYEVSECVHRGIAFCYCVHHSRHTTKATF